MNAATHCAPRFGAHMSVAGGLENAIHAALEAECDALQIFVKNQRQWSAPPLTPSQIEVYRSEAAASGLAPVVAHASYLINLASPDTARRRQSQEALGDELDRCEVLGLDGLVVHPGARMEGTEEAAIRRIAASLDTLHHARPGYRVRILLESTAGQGSTIGHTFEQLAAILDRLRHPQRAGICLDTCHLFAAGYDFRSAAGYQAMMSELDTTIGRGAVHCIHVNDSKGTCGSHLDRHEHIGKGKIGKAGFANFVRDPRWAGIPMILETPKGQDGRGADFDRVNLRKLRKWMEK